MNASRTAPLTDRSRWERSKGVCVLPGRARVTDPSRWERSKALCVLPGLLLLATLASVATQTPARAEESGESSSIGDVQVRSSPDGTDITLELPRALREEDRTERRPGLSAAGEVARIATPEPVTPTPPPTPEFSPTPGPTPTPRPDVRARGLTVNEVHLFFPGVTIPQARLITVDDRIVQEARLYPDQGGVSMTVVAGPPLFYAVSR